MFFYKTSLSEFAVGEDIQFNEEDSLFPTEIGKVKRDRSF